MFKCDIDTHIGSRPYNEDRTLRFKVKRQHLQLRLFGVADGHGGDRTVNYIVMHLRSTLLQTVGRTLQPLWDAPRATWTHVFAALHTACEGLGDGATLSLVVALTNTVTKQTRLWCVNVGDSTVYGFYGAKGFRKLSSDHNLKL